ncbi:immunoglobulin-like domain-containing protein [Listeria booriae]|uniref:Bacterial Ig domain-containing protein n=1 Tax=Listeria booriae TaxID=1552123 RepID=A0A7X0XR34_9LIST|nr:immunoglobulin-like domain-containing protein [Listeria booriae]MBC1779147.1 hypothetical protein [Listeria booriae]
MIFNTQINKKILSTLGIVAILGSTIATPFNVLSAEAAVQTVAATSMGPELINKNFSLFSSTNKRFQNFTVTGEYTQTPLPTNGFEMTGTDPNRYELDGQKHRMVLKSNPFDYYFHEVHAIQETAVYTAVTVDTTIGQTYAFNYTYKLSNSNISTSLAKSQLTLEAGVNKYGGDKIGFKKYSMQGNKEGSIFNSDTIEFKATSTRTIVYARAGYTHLNSLGGQHFAALTSYSLKQIIDESKPEPGNGSGSESDQDEVLAAVRSLVRAMFNNSDVTGTIKATLAPYHIDSAQRTINMLTNPVIKAEWQANLNKAKKQLNATIAVKALFNNDNVAETIKSATTQGTIDSAKALVGVVTNAEKKTELEAQIAEAQKQLDTKAEQEVEQAHQDAAKKAVEGLFNNDDVTGTITDSTNQEAINNAKELVVAITDEDKKAELEAQLVEAQKQLDAKTSETVAEQARQEAATNAVKELFNNNDVTGTIKDSTTQDAINKAKELVATVTDADKKAELEAQLTEAQKQLDAKTSETAAEQSRQEAATNAVEELFNNNDVTGTIKDSTNQEDINKAKELVAAITDTDKKAELEKAITEAQKQLTEKETKVEITGKANPFILHQDRYLSGTYTGDITGISVDVNDKRYYGGTVKDGEFSFYALDKIANLGDIVIINLHSADKVIQKSITVQIKEANKVTQAAYSVKDSNITGTFNNPDITKMNIVVNGTTYWGGTFTNGTFKFYALDKMISATDEVTMNFFNANNELIISKNLTITAPVVTSGEITSATLAVGDKNIVGTITGDIKSFGVTIDGTTYNGGTIAADGTFKFYVADKKFTADSAIKIVGYDKAKTVLSEVMLIVSK